VTRRALMITELELAARPAMNPAAILWPAWPGETIRPQATARTRRAERERPLWFYNAPELNAPAPDDGEI
jgi:hypothetical protein